MKRRPTWEMFKKTHVDRWEKRYLLRMLEKYNWNVCQLARWMNMDRNNVYRLLRKHGLVRPVERGEYENKEEDNQENYTKEGHCEDDQG